MILFCSILQVYDLIENAEPVGTITHTCTKVVVHREYKMNMNMLSWVTV